MPQERFTTEKIFHRGLDQTHNLPNSFKGIELARPGDIVELDVFMLRDGSLAVVHNKDLLFKENNLTMEDVEAMDFKQFQGLDQPKSRSAETVKDVAMPLFEEVLGLACDREARLMVEIKAGSVEGVKALALALVEKIFKMNTEGAFKENPLWINNISFFSMSVEGMSTLVEKLQKQEMSNQTYLAWPSSEAFARDMIISETAIAHALLLDKGDWFERGIQIAKNIGCLGISIHAGNLIKNPKYVELAHSLGLKIMAGGVVNDESDMDKLQELGVDSLMSEQLKRKNI